MQTLSARPALVAALSAAIITALCPIAMKIAVRDIPPVTLNFLRYVIGTSCLFGMVLAGSSRAKLRVRPYDLPSLALGGFLAFAFMSVALSAALVFTSASRVATLFASTPLWGMVIAVIRGAGFPAGRKLLGVMSTIAGIVVLTSPVGPSAAGSNALFGDVLVLLAALSVALAGVQQKAVMRSYDSFTITFYRMAFAAAMLMPVAVFWDASESLNRLRSAGAPAIWSMVFLGVFGGAVMAFLWGFALSRLAVADVLVFMNLMPVITAAVAVLFLHEAFTWRFAIACTTVIGGVVLTQTAGGGAPSRPRVSP